MRSVNEDRDGFIAEKIVEGDPGRTKIKYRYDNNDEVSHTSFFYEGRRLGSVEGFYATVEAFLYEQGQPVPLGL